MAQGWSSGLKENRISNLGTDGGWSEFERKGGGVAEFEISGWERRAGFGEKLRISRAD
jgi:hypothetical protein